MKLWHDRSHLSAMDGEYISRGYAEDDLFCVRIDFEYTEEQQQENSRIAKKMTPERWAIHCDKAMQRKSAYIFPVIDSVAKAFACYQYDREHGPRHDSPDWELFFWCNDFSNTSNGKLSGRDYSYIRLNFNDLHDAARHKEICNRLLLFLTEHFSELDNLSVAVQYKTRFFEEKIDREAKEHAKRFGGMKYRYRNMDGSLFCTESGLIFMKKRARPWLYAQSASNPQNFVGDGRGMSESKAERTRRLRYKRPALASLGYDLIAEGLREISSAVEDVQ